MFSSGYLNNISKTDVLPPLHVPKKTKESKEWQQAILDSFEHIGIKQLNENLSFWDYYRMVDGKMAYQELREVIPHLDSFQDLLDGVGIPTFLRHYDIIGIIINALVNKYAEMQDKFHIVDVGEVAENEFLRFRNEEIQKVIQETIENEIQIHLAENGLSPDGKQFASEEEQQAFLQQLQQARAQYTPQDTLRDAQKSFKTIGVQWGEATLDKDKDLFKLEKLSVSEFRDYLLSGRCFREYKIGYDKYYPKTWSPKNTFFSKELDNHSPQKGQYIGRVHHYTPSEVIKEYGHLISTDLQKKILGGNEDWKTFISTGVASASIEESIKSNFSKPMRVPFDGYFDYNFALGIEDELSIPMGTQTLFHPDGTQTTHDRFLPRMLGSSAGRYSHFATVLRDDIGEQRKDLCQVTEVYFIAYDLFGYLTYENEFGRIVREEVTEDILPEFLKEKGIKKSFKQSISDIVEDFEVNTLKWVYVPNTYEGVKIQCQNLDEPIYLYCKKMDHQIKGDSEFDRLLPVGGHIGRGIAEKIAPFQAKYNLCMNQIYNLLEKEIGMFFLLDTALIPSEYQGYGDAQEALVTIRNIAKDTGILPIATSGDNQKNQNNFNQFSVYDISYTQQISNRIQIAEFCQRKAYEQIGINPAQMAQPAKYQTAEGVKVSQEVSWLQTIHIFNEFNDSLKDTLELHLSVAQYAQANKKDISIYYTKSDASIQYLKLSDPEFPLRRIGLIPSEDNRKRKDLETFRTALLNMNTLGSDTLELAKLIASDSYSEVIEIARIERQNRDARAQQDQANQQALIQQKAEADNALQDRIDAKEDERQIREIEKDIKVAEIMAAGRAADENADAASFNFIAQTADRALKENTIEQKARASANDLKLRERQHEDNVALKAEALKLKAQELQQRIQDRQSANYRATINKN